MTGTGITAPHPIASFLICMRNTFKLRVVLARGKTSGKSLLVNAVVDSKILGKHKESSNVCDQYLNVEEMSVGSNGVTARAL